jgi:nuclear receptor
VLTLHTAAGYFIVSLCYYQQYCCCAHTLTRNTRTNTLLSAGNNRCLIDRARRNWCPACRLRKCFVVQMNQFGQSFPFYYRSWLLLVSSSLSRHDSFIIVSLVSCLTTRIHSSSWDWQ